MSSLAQRIRDIRYKKGLGPDALAARAEISRTALYQIECGKTEVPRAGTLRRIAQALEVPVDQLLGLRPMAEPTEPAGPFSGRPLVDSNRAALNAPGSDWAYPDETDAAYPEGKRTFAPIDQREDLMGMLDELLDSRYGDSVARIILETHKVMTASRPSTANARPYADMRYRSTR